MCFMKYNLSGVNGNALSIIAYVSYAMRAEKFSRQEIKAYRKDAMRSDYNHVLLASMKMIEECNDRAE